MIFLTVGSQMSFDRLVAAVDEWAGCHPSTDVLAQIGKTQLNPKYLRAVESLSSTVFSKKCQESDLIIAHAGMGSILTAMQYGKPIVVMPRKGSLRETRNDHQIAAAAWLRTLQGVYFADDESSLAAKIDAAVDQSLSPTPIALQASGKLINALSNFVNDTKAN
jgi:UDP-N-acetylglucosamine transferase subunit ALG13